MMTTPVQVIVAPSSSTVRPRPFTMVVVLDDRRRAVPPTCRPPSAIFLERV